MSCRCAATRDYSRWNSSENLGASNNFLSDHEPLTCFLGVDTGLDDLYGLLTVSGNHSSEVIDSEIIPQLKLSRVRLSGRGS